MNHPIIRTGKFLVLAIVVALSACDNKAKQSAEEKADSTNAAATELPDTTKGKTGTLIGAWHDEAIKSEKGEQIAYELLSSGDKFYIQAITFVGNNLKLNDTPPVTPSASELKKDGDKYRSAERPEEYYLVDKDGDLLIYDGAEMVAKCKKLI
ncbi:hypothetical protein [Mucilaginibacter pedocola]|uniref:Uncharacterized protein n=1 Tax=Mucilaginibacter pedocola TaxID=1792845 RepID=A0A1S9P6C7_9SPHI|nr:hypothetical protein [Mucilaginibacter pedocola]OOQ56495.1 hypothetical protein BC343_18800 [Mucilaginibacter pedocola]